MIAETKDPEQISSEPPSLVLGQPPLEFRPRWERMAELGFVILLGTSVNNPILIVDRAMHNRRMLGMPAVEAVKDAVATRLRPILMTTPGLVISWICTLKGVPETPDVHRTSAPSATRLRGRILLLTKLPGYSSRSLLDPGLQSPIPCRDQEWIVQDSNH